MNKALVAGIKQWRNFYKPMESRFTPIIEQHHISESVRKRFEEQWEEINTYQKYKDYYSYGFYKTQKLLGE